MGEHNDIFDEEVVPKMPKRHDIEKGAAAAGVIPIARTYEANRR